MPATSGPFQNNPQTHHLAGSAFPAWQPGHGDQEPTRVAAILIEITDISPGPERDEAIDAAVRFLDAGIAALATSDK